MTVADLSLEAEARALKQEGVTREQALTHLLQRIALDHLDATPEDAKAAVDGTYDSGQEEQAARDEDVPGDGRQEPEKGTDVLDLGDGIVVRDASDFIAKFPTPPDALIEGLLCRRHVMLICANAGVGKSYTLADLSLCVTLGMPWLGFPCKRGRVLLVNPEEPGGDFESRFQEVRIARGMDVGDMPPGRLVVVTTRGVAVTLEELASKIIDSAEHFDLICLDSINALIERDENDSCSVRKLFITVNRLAEATGAAVVMMHHITSKAAPGKMRKGSRARGSSVFLDAPDCYIELVPLDVPEGGGASELLAMHAQRRGGNTIYASAHRMQFCKVRRFPRPRDLDLIWRYPVLIPDPTAKRDEGGELAECAIGGSKAAAAIRGGEAKSIEDAKRWREQDEGLISIVDGIVARGDKPTCKAVIGPFNELRATLNMDPVTSDSLRRYTAEDGRLTWRRRPGTGELYRPEGES